MFTTAASSFPIAPSIVLYNGEERWTASANLAELIDDEQPLGKYSLYIAEVTQLSIEEIEYLLTDITPESDPTEQDR